MSSVDGHTHSKPIAVEVEDTAKVSQPVNEALLEDLVSANHILYDQGVVDAFGHVSVRHDKNAERFLLARNMAPGRVSKEDIVEFTLDGDAVNANGRRVYLERFIHGEIYRQRPDVMAIVHSHSHSIVPLSVVKQNPLKAIFHMAGFIGNDTPIFEIRDAGGDATDLLVSNNHLGKALAEHFTDHDIVLMRGHGSTVVANDLKRAVYRAVYAELNAQYQIQASLFGEITPLSEGESKACVENIEAQVHRPWDLWLEQVQNKRQ